MDWVDSASFRLFVVFVGGLLVVFLAGIVIFVGVLLRLKSRAKRQSPDQAE